MRNVASACRHRRRGIGRAGNHPSSPFDKQSCSIDRLKGYDRQSLAELSSSSCEDDRVRFYFWTTLNKPEPTAHGGVPFWIAEALLKSGAAALPSKLKALPIKQSAAGQTISATRNRLSMLSRFLRTSQCASFL